MHRNNFDFLRLLFAVFVVITHAWPLSATRESDLIDLWTDHQICFSYLGVRGFFIISGYLIYQSMVRSSGLLDYFWKRALRLWPALLVFSLVMVLVGPLMYDAAIGGAYWGNSSVWSFLPRNATLYMYQDRITGIFEANPYPKIINGSLWTICIEFTCYVLLAGLMVVRKERKLSIGLLGAAFVALIVVYVLWWDDLYFVYYFFSVGQFFELATFFVAGSILAATDFARFKHTGWVALAATVMMALAIWQGVFLSGVHFLLLPLLVIGVGVKATPGLRDVGRRLGDISYGIYIYGFPVQQVLMYYFGLDCLGLLLASVPAAMACGFASWHMVEKRALELKRFNPSTWVAQKLAARR